MKPALLMTVLLTALLLGGCARKGAKISEESGEVSVEVSKSDPDRSLAAAQKGTKPTAPAFISSVSESEKNKYPREVAAILDGKQFVERTSKNLSNPFFDLAPINPILRNAKRMAKPISHTQEEYVRTYGYKAVIPKAGFAGSLPPYVIFHEPLTSQETHGSNGKSKVEVYVGLKAKYPNCVDKVAVRYGADVTGETEDQSKLKAIISNPKTPGCSVETALSAVCSVGTGAIIRIAGGDYSLNAAALNRCGGVVITNWNDETVSLTSKVDFSQDASAPWKLADPANNVWVAKASKPGWDLTTPTARPLFLNDQFPIEKAPGDHGDHALFANHLNKTTLLPSADSKFTSQPTFLTSAPPVYHWQPFAKYETLLYVSSLGSWAKGVFDCSLTDLRIVKGEKCDCKPADETVLNGEACNFNFELLSSDTITHQYSNKYCKKVFGAECETNWSSLIVPQFFFLRLPAGKTITDYKIESLGTGRLSFTNPSNALPHMLVGGVLIRGLKIKAPLPIEIEGLSENKLNEKGWPYSVRFDGIELDGLYIVINFGEHHIIENSFFNSLDMTGDAINFSSVGKTGPMRRTRVRNNYFEGFSGKVITHTVLDGGFKAGPSPVVNGLWSETDDTLNETLGYNSVYFNTFNNCSALNANLHGWLVIGNYFAHGSIQECIADIGYDARYLRVHQNWCENSIGTGISVYSFPNDGTYVKNFEISDNQFIRHGFEASKNKFLEGPPLNPDQSYNKVPSVAIWSNDYGFIECENLTIQNNLFAKASPWGQMSRSIQSTVCKNTVIRNNTVTGGEIAAASYSVSMMNDVYKIFDYEVTKGTKLGGGRVGITLSNSNFPGSTLSLLYNVVSDFASGFQDARLWNAGLTSDFDLNANISAQNLAKVEGNFFELCLRDPNFRNLQNTKNLDQEIKECKKPEYRSGFTSEPPQFASPEKNDFRILNASLLNCSADNGYAHAGFNYWEETCDPQQKPSAPYIDMADAEPFEGYSVEQILAMGGKGVASSVEAVAEALENASK